MTLAIFTPYGVAHEIKESVNGWHDDQSNTGVADASIIADLKARRSHGVSVRTFLPKRADAASQLPQKGMRRGNSLTGDHAGLPEMGGAIPWIASRPVIG